MAKNPKKSTQFNIKCWSSLIAIKCIRAYQLTLSPLLGDSCRFYPSCSQYAIEAYQQFGIIKGSWLTLKRLVKCHPWHQGGVDLLPVKTNESCCQISSDNTQTNSRTTSIH